MEQLKLEMPSTIRVGFLNFTPWTVVNELTESTRAFGLVGSLFDNITASLNITYQLFPPLDGQYGIVLPNMTTTGQLKMVEDGYVDMALGPFRAEYNMYKLFHLTPVSIDTRSIILSGMRKAYANSPVQLQTAFDSLTWILLGISCVIATGVLSMEYAMRNSSFDKSVVIDQLFIILQTLFQEATKKRFTRVVTRYLGGAFIVSSFILSIAFSNQGKANLVVQAPTMRYNTLQQAIDNPKMIIYYPTNTAVHLYMLALTGEKGAKLHARMAKEGALVSPRYFDEQRQEEISSSKAVLLIDEVSVLAHVSQWCMEFEQTGRYYYIGTEVLNTLPVSFVLSRNLSKTFRDKFDKKILDIVSYGVPFMRAKDLYRGHFHCMPGNTNKQAEELIALDFQSSAHIFKLLFIMLIACTGVFLIEIATNCYTTSTAAKR